MLKLPCSHYWCQDCCVSAFALSTTDLSSMPPKCCGRDGIHIKAVRQRWHGLFSSEFKKLWAQKFAEHKDVNPIYCPNRRCSAWIPKEEFSQNGRSDRPANAYCRKCSTKVCQACKMESHGKEPCDVDRATKDVIDMIQNEPKSQQCPNCLNGVSKTTGCNHMSCMCGCQFCLKCGLEWTGDSCRNGCPYIEEAPDTEEDRLLAEAFHRRLQVDQRIVHPEFDHRRHEPMDGLEHRQALGPRPHHTNMPIVPTVIDRNMPAPAANHGGHFGRPRRNLREEIPVWEDPLEYFQQAPFAAPHGRAEYQFEPSRFPPDPYGLMDFRFDTDYQPWEQRQQQPRPYDPLAGARRYDYDHTWRNVPHRGIVDDQPLGLADHRLVELRHRYREARHTGRDTDLILAQQLQALELGFDLDIFDDL